MTVVVSDPGVGVVQPTRRTLLASALATAGATGLARAGGSAAAPVAAQALPGADSVLHAVRRLSFGPTPALLAHVRTVGVAAWLDDQLAAVADPAAQAAAPGTSGLPLPYPAATALDASLDQVKALQVATFAHAAWGDAQVRELLVELWSNHLSIAAELDKVRAYKLADDRDVIRAHALGSVSDLLAASAQSPAMLLYLDNASSRGTKPNENYARELLELHTVGVHGGYTQRDVRDAARVLTGLTVDERTGTFVFRPEWHATGPVRVLGWSHPNAVAAQGLDVALAMVRYLAAHPATAQRIATKLVRRLVADEPPAALVASAARTYLAANTEIVPVVRHIVGSSAFARSVGQKSQRPLDWCVAAVRALQLQPQPTLGVQGDALLRLLDQVGQVPFAWIPPDGYPDDTTSWASTAAVLARWNAAQALVNGAVAGLKALDVDALVGTPVPVTAGALVDRLVSRMLGVPTRSVLRSALLRAVSLAATAAVDQAAVRRLTPQLAALILSAPEAQVR